MLSVFSLTVLFCKILRVLFTDACKLLLCAISLADDCTVAHKLVQFMDWVSMFDHFYNQYCSENVSSDHV